MATNKIGAPGWCCPTDSDLQGPCYSCLTTRAKMAECEGLGPPRAVTPPLFSRQLPHPAGYTPYNIFIS